MQTTGTKFEGREPTLKGFIYDLPEQRNADQYVETTKEIAHYVSRTYKECTADLVRAVNNLSLDMPVKPTPPSEDDKAAFEDWKLDNRDYREKSKIYKNFKAGLYGIVLGQCTKALETKMKSHPDFPKAEQDGIALLKIVKVLTYTFEDRKNIVDASLDVKEQFYTFYQGKNMPLQRYFELFENQVEVCEEVGVDLVDRCVLKKVAEDNDRTLETATADDRSKAKDYTLAMRFIRGASIKHQEYLKHLRNSYLDGHDVYPTTLQEAFHVLQ
jgi:hypothetical protein